MNWRYRGILLFFACLFLLTVGRLFYWQVVRAEELASIGESQYGQHIKLTPERGEIRTADGYPIASNQIQYLVFANPKEVKDVQVTSDTLASLLHMDSASISALLSMNRFWVAIKNGLSDDDKKAIESHAIPGVGFEEQSVRYYPEASMAAHLLGFVGKNDNGDPKGYFGLEGYYDRQLRGKTIDAVETHDAFGRPILAKMDNNPTENDGRSLNLHIDRAIQFMMDKTLKDGLDKYGASGGVAIAMNPKDGAIIGMSSFPDFDPSHYQNFPPESYTSPLVTSLYEPGSTFKPLVMAAAMNEGLVKPDTTCPICGGPVEIGGYAIHTWNNEYHPNLTMTEVIQHSDNTGMTYVSKVMGLDRMLKYFDRYGIGQTTGIDVQGEEAGEVRPRDSWYPIDVATASFGQGITVTPIELIDAFASIANNGIRMEPHIVASVETPSGETIPIPPKELSRPISPESAKIMTEMLVNAVDHGEAAFARLKGYRIAGKTGTAQIPIAGHYDSTQTIASFIGYAPAEDPKFVMLVVVDRPTSSIYGAETAAPLFFDMAGKMLTYYGISPSNDDN